MNIRTARVAPEKAVFRPVLPLRSLPGLPESKMASSYALLLKRPEWQKKRLEILNDRGWACESCDDTESTLHVHHRAYIKGRKPWEYDEDQLEVLCEACHEAITAENVRLACILSRIATHDLETVIALLSTFFTEDEVDYSPIAEPLARTILVLIKELRAHVSLVALQQIVDQIRSVKEAPGCIHDVQMKLTSKPYLMRRGIKA
jgi:hypothetical protein